MSEDFESTLKKIDQIERAHRSARPKHTNPAWMNTHSDLGYVLKAFRTLQNEFAEVRWMLDGLNK